MKKIIILFLLLFLSGCATYKFQHGKTPYNKGYVVLRDGYTIPEYTIGKDNSVPDIELAKQRFNRRRKIVEHYYKKMDYIENRFKMAFYDPAVFFVKLIGGILRLPLVAISDYRCAHNSRYRERIRKLQDDRDAREEARISKLKEALGSYIQRDLSYEEDMSTQGDIGYTEFMKQKTLDEALDSAEKQIAQEKPAEKKAKPKKEPTVAKKEKPKAITKEKARPSPVPRKSISGEPVAVIIAKPTKGHSPLKVRFYGHKSYVPKGRIISYLWDFGDGDSSSEKNPVNTYYSTSVEPKYFTVTLTVHDDRGMTEQTTTTIEVLNK